MGRERRERRAREGARAPAEHAATQSRATAPVLALQRSAGNQAVQRILGRPTAPTLQRMPYIVQAGYMSGDMFGISAALLLNPRAGVLILQESSAAEAAKREPDQSQLFSNFYKASLAANNVLDRMIALRVKVASVDNAQQVYKDLVAGGGVHGATVRTSAGLTGRDTFVAAGVATSMVGEAFATDQEDSREKVTSAWSGGAGPSVEEMQQFLADRGVQPGRKYALLWVRLSAKTKMGGAHAELDTSIEGVRDLKREIHAQTGREIVLVGDDPAKADLVEGAINLLQFWDHPPFSTIVNKVEKRMAQLRLYSYMLANGYDLVSVGMRSGAMEGPALLGVPTVYIEEKGNQQHERMEKWIGKVPGWSQAAVGTLPTRTGRRYQAGAVSLGLQKRRVDDATGAISRTAGGAFGTIKARLERSYVDDEAAFEANFIEASLGSWRSYLPRSVTDHDSYVRDYEAASPGREWSAKLRAELEAWHDEHTAWRAVDAGCTEQEQAVAAIVGGGTATVRSNLSGLRTAQDINAGLADFVREAAAVYRVALPVSAPLRTGLRKWRSSFTGKASLDKGFEDEDVKLILGTPKLRQDRVEHGKATLLNELDTLLGHQPGRTFTIVKTMIDQEAAPTRPQFRGQVLDGSLRGLRTVLGLPSTASRAAVMAKLDEHIKTPEGAEWLRAFNEKVRELHEHAWPA